MLAKLRADPTSAPRRSAATRQGFRIPSIVHLTFKSATVPNSIVRNVARNMAQCKGCEFRFYTDDDVEAFIRFHCDAGVYRAFCSINPAYGAMKADFFRYCVLYHVGGIYVDIKSGIGVPPFRIVRKSDSCVLDVARTSMEPWRRLPGKATHEQWLLMFAPAHPYLKEMIRQMCHTIDSRVVPPVPRCRHPSSKAVVLHITGPDAFAKAVRAVVGKEGALHRTVDYGRFFQLIAPGCDNYKRMYAMNQAVHYGDVHAPFYVNPPSTKTPAEDKSECERHGDGPPARETTCARNPIPSAGETAPLPERSPET
jgi:mannosyltransferase OCH1-like enzyme